jgi:hypothetical protein
VDPTALPTDNLYKFMALSGLGIAGFCLWFWWQRFQQLKDKLIGLRLDLAASKHKGAQTLADTERLEAALDGFAADTAKIRETFEEKRARFEALKASDPSPRELDQFTQELVGANDALDRLGERVANGRERLGAVRVEAQANKADTSRMDVQYKTLRSEGVLLDSLARALFAAGSFGLILSAAGFAGWYINVQWYADRQAKAEFEDRMAELSAKRKARDDASWAAQHNHK